MIKVTLPNGLVVEGTLEQVTQVATSMGYPNAVKRDDSRWHYSESKKTWVEISTMDTGWLKNSVLKIMRDWMEDVVNASSPKEMVRLITDHSDTHLAALLRALNGKWGW